MTSHGEKKLPTSEDHGVTSLGSIMQCIEIDTKIAALNCTGGLDQIKDRVERKKTLLSLVTHVLSGLMGCALAA